MSSRIASIALLSWLLGACATMQAWRPLTVETLERAGVACGAPDAELHTDEYHVSIVFDGDTPDRERQSQCLFERLRGQRYWFDQIVIQGANRVGS